MPEVRLKARPRSSSSMCCCCLCVGGVGREWSSRGGTCFKRCTKSRNKETRERARDVTPLSIRDWLLARNKASPGTACLIVVTTTTSLFTRYAGQRRNASLCYTRVAVLAASRSNCCQGYFQQPEGYCMGNMETPADT